MWMADGHVEEEGKEKKDGAGNKAVKEVKSHILQDSEYQTEQVESCLFFFKSKKGSECLSNHMLKKMKE